MAKINSRSKGKRGELEAAEVFRKHGYEARRGQQFQGGGDSPDLVHSLPGFHVEVKRVEALNLYEAFEQAERDRHPWEVPVVMHRRNHKPWLFVVSEDAFFALVARMRGVKS